MDTKPAVIQVQSKYILPPELFILGTYDDSSYLSTSPLPWHVGHSPIISSPWDSAFGCCVTGNLPGWLFIIIQIEHLLLFLDMRPVRVALIAFICV